MFIAERVVVIVEKPAVTLRPDDMSISGCLEGLFTRFSHCMVLNASTAAHLSVNSVSEDTLAEVAACMCLHVDVQCLPCFRRPTKESSVGSHPGHRVGADHASMLLFRRVLFLL